MINTPFFTIIIPTLNEEQYLPLLLEDLSHQTYSNFNVIHVDGNSDDNTIENAAKFNNKLNFVSHSTDIRNVSFQRNLGIDKANGEWLIFMDADNRIPKYFLDGVRYRLAKDPKTMVFTTWVYIDKEKTLNKQIEKTLNYTLELGKIAKREWSFGALIGVKRSIMNKNFYFDQKQKFGEDGIFVKKLADNGYEFNIFKDPKYTYSVRRLDSEGTINMARTGAKVIIQYIQGKDFSEHDFGYKMDGGTQYDNPIYLGYYQYFQSFFKSASKKQIEQAKRLFKSLTKFDI